MFKSANRFEAYECDVEDKDGSIFRTLILFVKSKDDEICYAKSGYEKDLGMLSLTIEVLKRFSVENSGVLKLSEGLTNKEGLYEIVSKAGVKVADEHGFYYDKETTPLAEAEFSDKNFYFTFNKDEKTNLPYHDAYLIVRANNIYTALDLYQINHPNMHENIINCSFYYGFPQWEKEIKQHFKGMQPKEIITAENTMERFGRVEYSGSDADRDCFEEERQ